MEVTQPEGLTAVLCNARRGTAQRHGKENDKESVGKEFGWNESSTKCTTLSHACPADLQRQGATCRQQGNGNVYRAQELQPLTELVVSQIKLNFKARRAVGCFHWILSIRSSFLHCFNTLIYCVCTHTHRKTPWNCQAKPNLDLFWYSLPPPSPPQTGYKQNSEGGKHKALRPPQLLCSLFIFPPLQDHWGGVQYLHHFSH